jgi:hypothetical protein
MLAGSLGSQLSAVSWGSHSSSKQVGGVNTRNSAMMMMEAHIQLMFANGKTATKTTLFSKNILKHTNTNQNIVHTTHPSWLQNTAISNNKNKP